MVFYETMRRFIPGPSSQPTCASVARNRHRLVPPQRTAGPKPIVQVIGAKLGASMDISLRVPSLAYRLCMAARRVVDFAIASENADDWDIAAADCLLEEAGARLVDATGERLLYNTKLVRRRALLASSEALAPRLLDAFRANGRAAEMIGRQRQRGRLAY